MPTPQTFANHRRIDPWYHYVAFSLVAMAFIWSIIRLCHSREYLWQVITASALLVVWAKVRVYALRVQDRVIRLEETLRMNALLPEALKARISELKPGQFVALRFASDLELAARVEEALMEGLGNEAIKKRIQMWRPDTFRV